MKWLFHRSRAMMDKTQDANLHRLEGMHPLGNAKLAMRTKPTAQSNSPGLSTRRHSPCPGPLNDVE